MGDISSGNIKSVDVFSVDCEVEGEENEVVLREELPVTSELQAQSEAVPFPFMTAVLLHRGFALLLLHRNQSLKKYSCSRGAVALKPLIAIFPVCTSRYALPKSSDTS